MIELALCILSGALRRVDGMDKSKWTYGATAKLLTRLLPVVIGVILALPYCSEWWHYIIAVCFGGAVSGSLQRGFEDWKKFNQRQLTQYWYAAVGYLVFIPVAPLLTLSGCVCCLLAGLTHPVLARTQLQRYTEVAEFLVGFLLFLPFVVCLAAALV